MRVILLLTILLALIACLDARVARVSKGKISRLTRKSLSSTKICGTGWGSFKQTDAPWKSEMIATKTIGAVGCAMTSVCNALKSRIPKIKVDGADVDLDPSTLNKWLKANAGYSGNGIFWAKVDTLGETVHMKFRDMSTTKTIDQLKTDVEACNAVIANVRGGGHWVLLTGALEGNKFSVVDPGFNQADYLFTDIVRTVTYDFKTDPAAAAEVHQEAAAEGAPAAVEAAVAPPTDVPPTTEAAAAEAAATTTDSQAEITLAAADIDLLKTANGGDFGGDGPAVADAAAGGATQVAAAEPPAADPAVAAPPAF